jgi:hypothetical protein
MRMFALVMSVLLLCFATPAVAGMPHPDLQFMGTEEYQAGGQTWIRYKLGVSNRAQFSNNLFNEAPNLPPCGSNTHSSRTWVDIHNGRTPYARIYGFCALGSSQDLGHLWFAVEKGHRPPRLVFVKLTDRRTGDQVSSNRVATY